MAALNSLGFPTAPPSSAITPVSEASDVSSRNAAGPVSASVGDSLFNSDRSGLSSIPRLHNGPPQRLMSRLEASASDDSYSFVQKAADTGAEVSAATAFQLSLVNRAYQMVNSGRGPETMRREELKSTLFKEKIALRGDMKFQVSNSKAKEAVKRVEATKQSNETSQPSSEA